MWVRPFTHECGCARRYATSNYVLYRQPLAPLAPYVQGVASPMTVSFSIRQGSTNGVENQPGPPAIKTVNVKIVRNFHMPEDALVRAAGLTSPAPRHSLDLHRIDTLPQVYDSSEVAGPVGEPLSLGPESLSNNVQLGSSSDDNEIVLLPEPLPQDTEWHTLSFDFVMASTCNDCHLLLYVSYDTWGSYNAAQR